MPELVDDRDPVAVEWGQNILEQRTARGWSQRHLADSLRVTPQAVSKWEKGLAAPNRFHQARLAGEFGLTTRFLFPLPSAAGEQIEKAS